MPFRLLRRILCGSGSARLHLILRERLGIVYSVDANIAAYEETGYFSIELSTAPENLRTAVAEVFAEILRLKESGVAAEELERVRNLYFYEMEYSRDSCFDMQIRFGWGELMAVVREIEVDMSQAALLTPEDLRGVASSIFTAERLNLVVVGAWSEKEKSGVLEEVARFAAGD
jgi:predicted Zn-dependent peptidase